LSKDRRICWKHKKEVIQKPPKRGISYTKQLAFKGRKSYEQPSPKCKKAVNYRVIYRDYKETELTIVTKKADLFAKRRVREQYIKSSDLALLYSEVNSYSAYNELTEDIFLNHTFDEDNFTMIQAFKEDTFPKKKVATKEYYDMMYHIFINCKLTATEAADYKYKCSKNDIEYDMNLIDQWYNESLQ
ncbi:20794_t:CDS:2, partial [Rhizophagus irregularis]